MRYSSANRGFPAGNPIANALVIVVGTLVIAASIVVGFFAFVVLGSALLILAAIIGVRLWWFRRKMHRAAGRGAADVRDTGVANKTIEGEYHIVIEDRENGPGNPA